jgi:hypothetical protein
MRKFLRKCKFSEDTLYLYAEFKKRDSFKKALKFHDMKVAITVGLLVVLCQFVLLILLGVI